MKRYKYALGLWEMLMHAMYEHGKRHFGLPPKRFVMHPANWCELRLDRRVRIMMFDPEKPVFMGVPIVVDVQADRLKMVTADNTVKYL